MEMYQFCYTRNIDSDAPIMLLDTHIGYDETDGMGIDASQFVNELIALDAMDKKCIDIWINSAGGNVMGGMSIYNAILKTKTKVDTYNVGIAASTAGWIFQAGRNRTMSDYSLLMMHNTSGADSEVGDKFNNSIATMISARCKNSVEDVLSLMDKTTWMTASEALMNGYCDAVTNSNTSNKKRVSAANDIKDNWKACAEITNSALSKITTVKNSINMSTQSLAVIANSLGLNAEASNESIAKEITALRNKADIAIQDAKAKDETIGALQNAATKMTNDHATEITKLQNEHKVALEAKDADILAVKNSVKDSLEELNTLKAEAATLVQNQLKENATKVANVAANAGKIKSDEETITKWVNKLIEDYDGNKELLDSIAGNKKAPVIDVANTSDGFKTGSVIGQTMAAIKNKMSNNN